MICTPSYIQYEKVIANLKTISDSIEDLLFYLAASSRAGQDRAGRSKSYYKIISTIINVRRPPNLIPEEVEGRRRTNKKRINALIIVVEISIIIYK